MAACPPPPCPPPPCLVCPLPSLSVLLPAPFPARSLARWPARSPACSPACPVSCPLPSLPYLLPVRLPARAPARYPPCPISCPLACALAGLLPACSLSCPLPSLPAPLPARSPARSPPCLLPARLVPCLRVRSHIGLTITSGYPEANTTPFIIPGPKRHENNRRKGKHNCLQSSLTDLSLSQRSGSCVNGVNPTTWSSSK